MVPDFAEFPVNLRELDHHIPIGAGCDICIFAVSSLVIVVGIQVVVYLPIPERTWSDSELFERKLPTPPIEIPIVPPHGNEPGSGIGILYGGFGVIVRGINPDTVDPSTCREGVKGDRYPPIFISEVDQVSGPTGGSSVQINFRSLVPDLLLLFQENLPSPTLLTYHRYHLSMARPVREVDGCRSAPGGDIPGVWSGMDRRPGHHRCPHNLFI